MPAICHDTLGKDHLWTLAWNHSLGVFLQEYHRYDEAEPLFIQAFEGRRPKLGDAHPHTVESMNNLIALYEAWSKPEKANEWRAKLPQTEAVDE